MSAPLIMPDGQPVPRQVQITSEQALAVWGQVLEGELNVLLAVFRLPPQVIAENLMRLIAALVAPAQPLQARQVLVENLIQVLRIEVDRRTKDLALQVGISNQVVNSR